MRGSEVLKGAAAGLLAGVAASWVVTRFQAVWNAAQERATGDRAEGGARQEDPPTVQAADRIVRVTVGEPVPAPDRERAGAVVHYLTGAGLGALYRVLAQAQPRVATGRGAAYGAATLLLLDEGLVPALKLAPSPAETAPAKHLYALASHLVFGVALDASLRVLRARL